LYIRGHRDFPPKESTQGQVLEFLRRQPLPDTDYVRRRASLCRAASPYRAEIMSDILPAFEAIPDAADVQEECMFVCEAAAQRLQLLGFRWGNVAIAQTIGLFLKGVQAANPDDPEFQGDSFGTLLFKSYVALHTVVNFEDIDTLSTKALARVGTANREAHRWVVDRKMSRLSFLQYELPRAFTGMPGDIWCLWIWVFREGDALFRFVEFGAAALIILIPTIEALGIPDMNALTENNCRLWKQLAQTLHCEQVLPVAQVLDAMK
jgi:hypothetical protein